MKKILHFFAFCLFVIPASFIYAQSAPTITSVSPVTARAGDQVTITGTGFGTSNLVLLSGPAGGVYVSANLVTTVNSNTIQFIIPNSTFPTSYISNGSSYTIRVKPSLPTVGSLTAAKNITILAHIIAPTITSIVPNQARIGDTVVITGTGFLNYANIHGAISNNLFGMYVGVPSANVSPTRITFQVPALTDEEPVIAGTYNLLVGNNTDGNSNLYASEAKVFTVLPSGTTPPVTAPFLETITGSNTATPNSLQTARINNFVVGSTLAFTNTGGGVEERPLTQQSGTIYTFPAPNAAGSYTNIRAKTPAGVYSNALANPPMGAYVVVPAVTIPTITSFTPVSGVADTVINVTGTGFDAINTPGREWILQPSTLSGDIQTIVSYGISSSTQLQLRLPTIAPGVYFFKFKSYQNGAYVYSATSTQSYTVIPPPAGVPTITNITPTSGTTTTRVTFTGTGFNSSLNILVYTANGSDALVGQPSSTTPTGFSMNFEALAPGTYFFKVRTIQGNTVLISATSTQSYTVTTPVVIPPPAGVPTITNITPTSGSTTTQITFTGTGFDASLKIFVFSAATGLGLASVIPENITSNTCTLKLSNFANNQTYVFKAFANSQMSATSTQSFTVTGPIVVPPTVQNIETITGSNTATPNSLQTARINNFVVGSTLAFTNTGGGVEERPLTQQSGTIYTFPAPNAAGSYTNIRAKTPAGVYSNALANPPMGAYVVVPVVVVLPPSPVTPTITGISPNPAQWGGTIVLTGTNFTNASNVITNEVVTVRLIENTTDASVVLATTALTPNRIVAKLPTATSTLIQYRVSVERKIGVASPLISNAIPLEIKSGGTILVPPPPPIPVETVQSIIKVGGKNFTLIATKSVDEGKIIALRVVAPSNMTRTTSFRLRVAGGTARTPSDYTSFGTVTIRFVVGGSKEKKISVRTKINAASEDDKTIKFRLISIDGRSVNDRVSPGITSTIINVD